MSESTELPSEFRAVVRSHTRGLRDLVDNVSEYLEYQLPPIANVMSQCLRNGGLVMWCGNGGSAADSQHLAAELVGRFNRSRKALRSVSLASDTSVLTCISNDFSYENVFSRQVEALASPGDVLVALSTSGQSANIQRALIAANQCGATTIGILGRDGGSALGLATHKFLIQSNSTARIQEVQILVGHIICDLIEIQLGYSDADKR